MCTSTGLERRVFLALLAAGDRCPPCHMRRPGGAASYALPRPPIPRRWIPPSAAGDRITCFSTRYSDALIAFDYPTLKPKPDLALSWSYPDPRTFVLDLRPGVVFHDGTPCDAEAVEFNLERSREDPQSNVKPDVATIAEVQVTGSLQVTLKLNQPNTALPLILSDRAGVPLVFQFEMDAHTQKVKDYKPNLLGKCNSSTSGWKAEPES
jgi:ABC-type transport system substrate-binding protein